MGNFIRLNTTHQLQYNTYIKEHFWNTFYLSIKQSQDLLKKKFDKTSGDYFGYFSEDKLSGVFVFSNNKILFADYIDESVLKKIDFFRAIKHFNPKIIKGNPTVVRSIREIISNITAEYTLEDYYIMTYEKDVIENSHVLESISNKIVDASFEFLVEVEKSFGRNPKVINRLKEKIMNKIKKNEYVYLIEQGKIIGQGMIETIGSVYAIIGGIYITQEYRSRGYGEIITRLLIQEVLKRKKTPMLLVQKRNDIALNLYKKLGFKIKKEYSILELELESI